MSISLFSHINKAKLVFCLKKKSNAMEMKRMQMLMALFVVAALVGVLPTTAHLPPGACIDHCLKECKLSGLGIGACIKYCPVHCLPPDASTKEHYCNLGCMLDECAKFTNDEKKMNDCVVKCRRIHCNINV